jgi:hypothetical protein
MNAPANPLSHLAKHATPTERLTLWRKIVQCVETSATKYPMHAGLTQSEVKRRVDFCVEFVGDMLRERNWTASRTADHIWPSLKAMLESRVIVLSNRAFYPVDAVE